MVNDTAVFKARSGATPGEVLWIEGQKVLRTFNEVRHQHRDEAENDMATVYSRQFISVSARTPLTR